MSQQSIKQRARRQALDVAARHRRELAEREKRLQNLVVQVLTALGERDAAVAATERRAGAGCTDDRRRGTDAAPGDRVVRRRALRARRDAAAATCRRGGHRRNALSESRRPRPDVDPDAAMVAEGVSPRVRARADPTARGHQGTPSQLRRWESCRRSVGRSSGSTGTSSPTPPRRRRICWLMPGAGASGSCVAASGIVLGDLALRPVRPSPAVSMCTPIIPRTSKSSARVTDTFAGSDRAWGPRDLVRFSVWFVGW